MPPSLVNYFNPIEGQLLWQGPMSQRIHHPRILSHWEPTLHKFNHWETLTPHPSHTFLPGTPREGPCPPHNAKGIYSSSIVPCLNCFNCAQKFTSKALLRPTTTLRHEPHLQASVVSALPPASPVATGGQSGSEVGHAGTLQRSSAALGSKALRETEHVPAPGGGQKETEQSDPPKPK